MASVQYYQRRRSGLGERFLDRVIETLAKIQAFPQIGRLDEGGFRVFAVKGFPFNVLYKPYPDFLYIAAIAHLGRAHGYWLERT